MRTTRQGGSVKVFIIVGVILALIALGVLYSTKRYAMNDQTPPLVVPSDQDGASQPAGDADKSSSDESDADTGHDEDAVSSGDSPRDQTEDKADDQSTDHSVSSPGSSSSSSRGGHSAVSDDLPQTGPEGGVAGVILALMTTSAIYYIRSLRK